MTTEGQENNDGHEDNSGEEWLSVAEDVSSVKFSDYISIVQDAATCCLFYGKENVGLKRVDIGLHGRCLELPIRIFATDVECLLGPSVVLVKQYPCK
ncbi:hypothetical protein NPIL_523651 [Nephila pilipes]|uniref:Uncharacterized protein n=1 Tax=Nephila pilipes TaxID=299642 RepID=A0A8X6PEU2_NEPPI|nr:hypothetical protein NPIL_523651 [Nephila pilipes]